MVRWQLEAIEWEPESLEVGAETWVLVAIQKSETVGLPVYVRRLRSVGMVGAGERAQINVLMRLAWMLPVKGSRLTPAR